jgi:hypothetical protein
MTVKSLLSAGLGAIAFGLVTTAAQAVPLSLTGALDQRAGRNELTEQVTWYGDRYYGRYRSYHGHRWYRHRHYGHGHYGYRGYGHRHYGWHPRYRYRHW